MDLIAVRNEIRKLLTPMIDEGTDIEGGAGFDVAHLWIRVGGKEFSLEIKDKGPYKAEQLVPD